MLIRILFSFTLAIVFLAAPGTCLAQNLKPESSNPVTFQREDFKVLTEDGLEIFVRKLSIPNQADRRGPILLVNGGRPGVLASWDVNAPATSVAEELARAFCE